MYFVLSFFCSFADLLQPFLLQYQTDNPFLLLLHDDMFNGVRNLLRIAIKSEILDGRKTLRDLNNTDLNKKENILTLS